MTTDLAVRTDTTSTVDTLHGEPWEVVAGAWLASYGSVNTQDAYRRDLVAFTGYLAGLGIPSPLFASRQAVDAWARKLEADALAPSTRARKLASVSSFFDYAATEGVLDRNPAGSVRRPKVGTESPRLGMTSEEARRVIAAAEAGTSTDRALVALCFLAGLRVSEALSVRVEDMTTEGGHQVVRVTGKGGRRAVVPLSPQSLRLLADALDATEGTGYVIRGPRGGRVDRHQALRKVEALGRVAGVGHKLRPHDLRHACATLALEAGAPLHRVQDLLRHASPTTTTRYTQHRDRLDGSAAYVLAGLVA